MNKDEQLLRRIEMAVIDNRASAAFNVDVDYVHFFSKALKSNDINKLALITSLFLRRLIPRLCVIDATSLAVEIREILNKDGIMAKYRKKLQEERNVTKLFTEYLYEIATIVLESKKIINSYI